MRRILALLVTAVSVLIAIPASEKRYVSAVGGLRVRDSAGLSGKTVAQLPFNDEVIILERSGKNETIDGLTRPWVKIRSRDKSGWAYEGFLAEAPVKKLASRTYKDGNFEVQFNKITDTIIYHETLSDFGNCRAKRTIAFGIPVQPTLVQVSIFQRDQFQCLEAADPREASRKAGEKGDLVFLFSWNVDALPSSVKPYQGITFKVIP